MIELTAEKALLITYSLWSWLAKTGHNEKLDWPGWKKFGNMIDCDPCCEYMKQQHKLNPNTVLCTRYPHDTCLLSNLWINEESKKHGRYSSNIFPACQLYDFSPWQLWRLSAPFWCKEDRKRYAAIIRDAAQQRYHEVRRIGNEQV